MCNCSREAGPWWADSFRFWKTGDRPYMLPDEGITCICWRPYEEKGESDDE
jgi:hypothetical protein